MEDLPAFSAEPQLRLLLDPFEDQECMASMEGCVGS
jgi:hypothetical protein